MSHSSFFLWPCPLSWANMFIPLMIVVNQSHSIPVALPGALNVQILSCYRHPYPSFLYPPNHTGLEKTELNRKWLRRWDERVSHAPIFFQQRVWLLGPGKGKVRKLMFCLATSPQPPIYIYLTWITPYIWLIGITVSAWWMRKLRIHVSHLFTVTDL